MYKIAIKLLVMLSLSLIISSCDPPWDSQTSIYVDNETDFSYLINVHYTDSQEGTDTTCLIKSNAAEQFIDRHSIYGEIGRGSACVDIRVICLIDSMCVSLDNCSPDKDGDLYYKRFINEDYVDQTSWSKRKSEITLTITINDSLRSVMKKNNELADSLLKLLN